jgi:hypothetical protein
MRRFPRLDTSKLTTEMCGQLIRKNFDHFRFPREHHRGRSLQDFHEMELITLRSHYSEIWRLHHEVSKKLLMLGRRDWSKEVEEACWIVGSISRELRRRHELG